MRPKYTKVIIQTICTGSIGHQYNGVTVVSHADDLFLKRQHLRSPGRLYVAILAFPPPPQGRERNHAQGTATDERER